jgi:hypothetical protein
MTYEQKNIHACHVTRRLWHLQMGGARQNPVGECPEAHHNHLTSAQNYRFL